MRKIILMVLIISPFFLFAQDAQTEKLMEQMGYKKVDLKALSQQQAAKPCTTCPRSKNKSTTTTASSNLTIELERHKSQIPKLEAIIKDMEKDTHADLDLLNKYKTTLVNKRDRIATIEHELIQANSSK